MLVRDLHRQARQVIGRRTAPTRVAATLLACLTLAVAARGAGGEPATATCVGDCDANGSVSVAEAVRSIRIALGEVDPGACAAADANHDGSVNIDENLLGVRNALLGCACPIDFADDNSAPGGPACVFAGRWNPLCGNADLEASFVGDGTQVVASLRRSPPVFFGARVTSPDSASLAGWFTREDLSDFEELGGTLTLGDDGRTLFIAVERVPFEIDGCDFAGYRGGFRAPVP